MKVKTLSSSSIIRYLLLIILPFYGCKEEDDSILYNDLESNIILRVREIHPSVRGTAPEISLVMFSQDTMSCGNIIIAYEIFKSEDQLNINLLGSPSQGICTTELGPARGKPLSLDESINKIILSYKDKEDVYDIAISATSTSVQPLKQSFTKFENTVYLRYVKNSFALICQENGSARCIKFKDTLISEIDELEEFSYPDEGLSPFYYQLENPKEAYLIYFTYLQRSDLFDAGVLLESFRKTASKGLTIISWDNYRF